MRRVNLMVFALAVLAAIAGIREETADPESSDHPASANLKGGDPARNTPDAGKNGGESHTAAGDHLLKTVATLDLPAEAAAQPGAVTNVSAPAAPVEVSFKPGAVDPALEDMDRDDLNAAAQTELRRLGCYEAKIDGRWGRKSEAAVDAFSERVGADWSERSRAELVTALRGFPAGHCSAAASAQPPASTAGKAPALTAGKPQAETTGQGRTDQSYLPPWMQGAKLSTIETPEITAPGAQKTRSDAGPASPKAKRTKNMRRREVRRERLAQGYERRSSSGEKRWLPKGWPGSRD